MRHNQASASQYAPIPTKDEEEGAGGAYAAADAPASGSLKFLAGAVSLVVGAMSLGVMAVAAGHRQSDAAAETNLMMQGETLSFAVGNALRSVADNDAREKWVVDYPWRSKLVEPHRATTFEARGCDACPDDAFQWTFGSDAAQLTGRTVTYTPTQLGDLAVSLQIVDPAAQAAAQATLTEALVGDSSVAVAPLAQLVGTVRVKYVRRELRSLGDTERTAALTAMHTIWSVDQATGVATYGPKFKDATYFVAKHLAGSAQRECDGWHDGAGFYTHHAAFSIEFEQAMQAVDPSVSLPYWDTTLDEHYQTTSSVDWQSSALWAGDAAWFGNVDAVNGRSDHAVATGSWALTQIKHVGLNNKMYPDRNPYGLLRSPWNTNPSTHLSRAATVAGSSASFSGQLPSCQASAACLSSKSMAVMNECLNGPTHGSAHILVGGLWHKDLAAKSLVDSSQAYQLLLITKNLWRRGFVTCPSACASATHTDEATGGACACSFNANAVPAGTSSYDILTKHTGVMHWVDLISEAVEWDDAQSKYTIAGAASAAEEAAAWDTLLKDTLSDPGFVGDMYTSASPYDPAFWILHGTVDRLVHWKRLVNTEATAAAGGVSPFDFTWGYADDPDASSDANTVCDWTAVDAGTAAMPACVTGTCAGHLADSELPFSGLVDAGTGDAATRGYTNQEMFAYLAPDSAELAYVYDDFSWAHCAAEGYAFGVDPITGAVDLNFQLPASTGALENVYK